MLSTVKRENAAGNKGSWQYLYDDNGNITRIITTVNDVYTTTYYHYDTAGQLIREDNQKAGTTTLWTYDNAGNILTEKVYAHTTGTPSTLRKTNTYTYTSTQWGDLLTAYNGNMIYYDGMTTLGSFKVGNPTTYNNGTAWTFTWEHGRQLATMTSGSTTWTNTYNSDGLRTSRTDGTTTYTYIYENGRLSAIKRNDLNMWIIYDDNGPVTLKYGSGTFHYVTNPQGDVVAIVGNQGQKLVEYTYDAWGKVTSITGDYAYNLGVHNPILYRGYIYDHETGLYYCQSRYYDPEIGRFLNADAFASTGQGLLGNNMFAYCNNNPVMYRDPSGEAALEVIVSIIKERASEALIDGLVGAAIDGVCTFATGGSWKDVGCAAIKGFVTNFIYGLVDDFFYVSKINRSIAVFNVCQDSGASIEQCLTAAAISVCFSYSFSSKSDGRIGKFVNFVFGLGSDLMVSGITEGIVRKSSKSVAQNALIPPWNSVEDSTQTRPKGAFGTNSVFEQVAF